jgi:serine phosphatase RsbU (regulator of sigma subunit)
VLLRVDGTVEQLPDADGCPLGVLVQDRIGHTVPMHDGDTVLLFTDGLIERRDEDIDVGQKKVLLALPTLAQADLDAALGQLVVSLREPSLDDDVAAVVARRTH